MESTIIKTSPSVSPPTSRHALADAKMSINLSGKTFSASTVGGQLIQNTSTGLSQLAPNQQKEKKGKEKVECHLCGKFLSNNRGLKCHIRVIHSKASTTNTKSETSLNSSQNIPASDQQVNNNDSDMGSSKPEMGVPSAPQNLAKNSSRRETTSKDMAVESPLGRGGNEKCVIMFAFGGRKLKLTTLVIHASV